MKAPKHFIQIPVKIAKRHDINSTDKLIYGEIHTLLNVVDDFYVSSGALGKDIGMNRRSVIRSLNHLKACKLIATNTVHDTRFKHDVRRYIYDLNSADKHSDRGVTKNSDRDVTKNSDRDVTKNSDRDVTKNSDRDVTQEYNTRRLNKRITNNTPRNILEKEFVGVDKLVQKKWAVGIPNNKNLLIANLIVRFGYQQVKNAINTTYDNGIGINGMPDYVKAVVFSNQNKPKRKSRTYSYGNQPIKEHIPDWAKDGYHEKLHPTSKKLQKKIQKQFKEMHQERKGRK